MLRNDSAYAEKAARIVDLTSDLSEILPQYEDELTTMARRRAVHTVAFNPPCTLQHGQQIHGHVENLLTALGIGIFPDDNHLCCGSAGTYPVLQPKLSYTLCDQKLDTLEKLEPRMIVSANVGCIAHLQSGTSTPVVHWIQLVKHLLYG
ncbi:MAG: Glycolate dehydrogenase (EC, iron-sulfur subunit GlcF [uncultured Caballeronia sp.]|nr:MAG: Glycolate dehydrogenase (EC, iron-sulfur subunit GlcF [uncultured Caballeronia sp.]